MKVKLETEQGMTILCVTEEITTQHASVLKAGLNRLFQSGKRMVLLDITAVKNVDPGVLKDIKAFQIAAPSQGAQLAIASLSNIGHAPTRSEALNMMASDIWRLQSKEVEIVSRLRKVERRMIELQQYISAAQSAGIDSKGARSENSKLKKRIREIEGILGRLLKDRPGPTHLPAVADRTKTIQRTLITVLELEGILPVN